MKKLIIFNSLLALIFLFTSNLVFARIHGLFSLEKSNLEHIGCYLTIQENGFYEISLFNSLSSDFNVSYTLSLGTYKVKDDKIVLIDKYNKYQIELTSVKNCLYVTKSFNWMKDRWFIEDKFHTKSDEEIKHDKIKTLKYFRNEYKKALPVKNSLINGVYSENGLYDYKKRIYMTIKGDCYRLNVADLIISEGTWTRKDNEMVLFDTTMKYNFYAFIKSQGLVCAFFPKFLINMELMKIEKNKTKSSKKNNNR